MKGMLKQWHWRYWQYLLCFVAAIGLAWVFSFSVGARADNVVLGFKAKGHIIPGNIVALDNSTPNTVILAPTGDPGRIYGVAIDSNQAPITVQDKTTQVFVATSGSYSVIASNENGQIKVGDYLSLSSKDGVAAKATEKTPFVLGRALEDFKSGPKGETIGRANVQISPGANPFIKNDIGVPHFLRKVAESVAGKPLSALRIYTALGMFIVAAAAAAGLLAIGVKSGMIAIGRNPLSRHSVISSLWQVLFLAAAVFFVSLFGIYLSLRL